MKASACLPAVVFITLVGITLTTTVGLAQNRKKTAKQIQALLQEKKNRTAARQKIDSQLLQAIQEYKGEKMAEGVVLQPVKLPVDSNGNLPVDISATVSDSLLNNIKRLGGRIVFPSQQYHTIRAQVPLLQVETIAGYAAVTFIQTAAVPMNNGSAHPMQENRMQPLPVAPPLKEVRDTPPY